MTRGALLLALVASGLAAQEPGPPDPPARPDSMLTASPLDTGFVAWRDRVAGSGRAGVSFLVEGERFAVLVLTPMAVDALRADSLVVRAARGCQRALALPDSVVHATAGTTPWREFDAATRARPVVAVVVLPSERRRFDCHAGTLARFAALSRGLQFGRFDDPVPYRDVARAEVRRDGLLEPPALAGRAPLTLMGQGGPRSDGSAHVRLYVAPEAFAPGVDGRAAHLEVHAWDRANDIPEVLGLPEPIVRAVWQQLQPWRAVQLAATAERMAVPLRLPMPRDSALRVAFARYDAGEVAAGSAGALDRLLRWPLPERREVRSAMLLSAAAFGAVGEEPAMASLLTDVLEYHPCLTFAREAPAAMRDAADRLRPRARCTSHPLPIIALRSLVPGGGQATSPGRTRLALTTFAGTAALYLAAAQLRDHSRREYERYLDYVGNTTVPPEAHYRRAESARRLGNAANVGAVGLWVFGGLEALRAEWRHARAIEEVREVGREPDRGTSRRRERAP